MNDDYQIISDIISENQFHKLNRNGLINLNRLRNIRIKREFIMLRTRMKPIDAIQYLSKKYFRSELTVHSIVYRKLRRTINN